MTYRLTKDEIGPLLLNIEEQTFQRIPDTRNSFFVSGRRFDYAERIEELTGAGIVPVWCNKTGDKGKRMYATVLSGESLYTFWNVENIAGAWKRNDIDKMMPGKAYFAYLEPEQGAENDYLIKSVIMIGDGKIREGVTN